MVRFKLKYLVVTLTKRNKEKSLFSTLFGLLDVVVEGRARNGFHISMVGNDFWKVNRSKYLRIDISVHSKDYWGGFMLRLFRGTFLSFGLCVLYMPNISAMIFSWLKKSSNVLTKDYTKQLCFFTLYIQLPCKMMFEITE